MSSNFMIGPIGDGLRKDIKPFATPNDSFATLINAYQFRGRIVRRKGYIGLGRLELAFASAPATVLLNGLGEANILSGFSLPATSSIVPGTVVITDTISPVI